jgi:hypothetical protein
MNQPSRRLWHHRSRGSRPALDMVRLRVWVCAFRFRVRLCGLGARQLSAIRDLRCASVGSSGSGPFHVRRARVVGNGWKNARVAATWSNSDHDDPSRGRSRSRALVRYSDGSWGRAVAVLFSGPTLRARVALGGNHGVPCWASGRLVGRSCECQPWPPLRTLTNIRRNRITPTSRGVAGDPEPGVGHDR